MRIGKNMRAFLVNIEAEPGMWSAKKLAADFDVSVRSARRSLRRLEEVGAVFKEEGDYPSRGGRREFVYYPSSSSSSWSDSDSSSDN